MRYWIFSLMGFGFCAVIWYFPEVRYLSYLIFVFTVAIFSYFMGHRNAISTFKIASEISKSESRNVSGMSNFVKEFISQYSANNVNGSNTGSEVFMLPGDYTVED